jgi:iron complex transport system permease protein
MRTSVQPPSKSSLRRWVLWLALLSVGILVVFMLCLSVGAVAISPGQALRILVDHFWPLTPTWSQSEQIIVLHVRTPRILLAVCVGAALAVAGTIFQALLRNPLADPYVLGISGGAAVGVMLATMIGLNTMAFGLSPLPIAAFAGALSTILLVYQVARVEGALPTHTLLLAGVIVSAFCTAAMMFLSSVVSSDRLQGVLFWIMGDLGTAEFQLLAPVMVYLVIGCCLVYVQAWALNVMTLGEDTALQLGVEVERSKRLLFVLGSLITGAAVSLSGMIGFVGLIIPHMGRMLVGPDHRVLLPTAALLGGGLLMVADAVARSVIAPVELPVGVVTALVGAPWFIYLLRRRRVT